MTEYTTAANAIIERVLDSGQEWPTTKDLRRIAATHGINPDGDFEMTVIPNVIIEAYISEEFCELLKETQRIGKGRITPFPMTMIDVLVREESMLSLPMPDNDLPQEGYPDDDPHWQPMYWIPVTTMERLMRERQ